MNSIYTLDSPWFCSHVCMNTSHSASPYLVCSAFSSYALHVTLFSTNKIYCPISSIQISYKKKKHIYGFFFILFLPKCYPNQYEGYIPFVSPDPFIHVLHISLCSRSLPIWAASTYFLDLILQSRWEKHSEIKEYS